MSSAATGGHWGTCQGRGQRRLPSARLARSPAGSPATGAAASCAEVNPRHTVPGTGLLTSSGAGHQHYPPVKPQLPRHSTPLPCARLRDRDRPSWQEGAGRGGTPRMRGRSPPPCGKCSPARIAGARGAELTGGRRRGAGGGGCFGASAPPPHCVSVPLQAR